MVSVGRSPRGLRARAAAWAQGARRAQGGRPRKRRRQRGRGPACRLPSRVSLFKAEGKRRRRGSPRQRAAALARGAEVGAVSARARVGRGAASACCGEREPAERRAPGLLRTSRARGCPGRDLNTAAGRARPPGRPEADRRGRAGGLTGSTGRGRAGREAGAAGLPSRAGGPPPPPGEPRGTRAGKHAQHREGSRTPTVPGDSKRTERPARSPPRAVRPRLWVSLAAGLSFRPRMPRCRVPPGKVAIENPRHPRPAPSQSPSDSHVGCFPACPVPGCRTMEAPLSPLWASSWRAHPRVTMQPESRATLSCLYFRTTLPGALARSGWHGGCREGPSVMEPTLQP